MALYALGDAEPNVHPDAFVHPDAVLIGAVELGSEASVWPGAVIRADEGPITIGARTSIQDGSVLHTTTYAATCVGADCVIGHLVHLEGCTIEDLALVGSGAVVLHEAVVETGALVGAGAVVPNRMRVPSGAMALGVPATIREGTVDAQRHIRPGVEAYRRRVRQYRADLRRLD
ncbi:MAG: gamma carbonic anhydrase family protein [Actinobacteria bacterium]|nr:gamma carbonic anhydrase family protein [Actinomycetota bacterium]